MIYLLVIGVVCGLAFAAWMLTARSAYESAAYSVLESDGSFELREYPDLMLATTKMGTRIQGDDGSFGRLFRYISGGNKEDQKIAMTTPVFMEPESEASDGQMGFVLPEEVAGSTIPQPGNEQVKIHKRAGGKFAVVRFAGRLSKENQTQQTTELESWIGKRGFAIVGQPEIAGYDPPWTPGPLRRNEILIRIE